MQTPNIRISTMNHRAYYMLLDMLKDKKKRLKLKLLRKYQDDMYDYQDDQIEGVLCNKSEEYYHLGVLIQDIEKSTVI